MTIQRKSKRSKGIQAGDSHSLKKNMSAANKLSCSHAPRHSNKRLFCLLDLDSRVESLA